MSAGRWIGPDETLRAGHVGFLVRATHVLNGWVRRTLQDEPVRTNMGGRPLLEGWAGTTDDVSVYALGLARVTKVARNGRAFVVALADEEVAGALEELGYPELAGDVEDAG